MHWTSIRWRDVLETAATVAVVAVWFVAIRPVALGGPASYIVVHGSSMSGALAPGDLVVTTAQSGYSPGDTIVYRAGAGAGQGLLVVHRIISADPAGYTMQGDANSYEDPWRPKASDVVGRLVVTLPGFGRFLAALDNPYVLAAVWGLVALVLGLSFLPEQPGPDSDVRPKPRIRQRRRLGLKHVADPSAALSVGLMVGLVVLVMGMILWPAWDLVAIVLSLGAGTAAATVGLFIRTTPWMVVPNNARNTPPAVRTPARRPILKRTAGWATAVMVGLVVVSGGATLSPAQASHLTAHSGVLTAQLNKCPPAASGACP